MMNNLAAYHRLEKAVAEAQAVVDAAEAASTAVQAKNPVLTDGCTESDRMAWEAASDPVELEFAIARIALSKAKIAFEENEISRWEQIAKIYS